LGEVSADLKPIPFFPSAAGFTPAAFF